MSHKLYLPLSNFDVKKLMMQQAKRTLKRQPFQRAWATLIRLYQYCRKENVYAYRDLLEIKRRIVRLNYKLQQQIDTLEQAIATRTQGMTLTHQTPETAIDTVPLLFSHPVLFEFAQILHLLDRVYYLSRLSKNVGLFTQQGAHLSVKDDYKRHYHRLLTHILQIPKRHYPKVYLNDYLANNEIYIRAINIHGEIIPDIIINAMQSTLSPTIPAHRLNQVVHQLKARKLKQQQSMPMLPKVDKPRVVLSLDNTAARNCK